MGFTDRTASISSDEKILIIARVGSSGAILRNAGVNVRRLRYRVWVIRFVSR